MRNVAKRKIDVELTKLINNSDVLISVVTTNTVQRHHYVFTSRRNTQSSMNPKSAERPKKKKMSETHKKVYDTLIFISLKCCL